MWYVSVRTAYIRLYIMRTALFKFLISTHTTIMYAYNNDVRVEQLCTHTSIMFTTYNNYVRVQQLCTCKTIMYSYNNYVRVQQLCTRNNNYVRIQQLCTYTTMYVKQCTRTMYAHAHIRVHAQAHPRVYTSNCLEKCIAPP